MALIRYNTSIPNLANSIFADFLTDFPTKPQLSPKVDIAETDHTFELHVSLPGFKKEDIHIEVEENKLTITGERKLSKDENTKKHHLVESEYGSFERSFTLPKNTKTSVINAQYTDGILQLSIPKEEKEVKKQQIPVK
jgi:HSP20 family protein